jgi:hypothetical protein
MGTELHSLRQTNADLVRELHILHKENNQLKEKNTSLYTGDTDQTQSVKTLIIGDSIIRDLDPTIPDKLEIKSISGANLETVTSTLQTLEKKKLNFERLIIVAGTKDCNNQNSSTLSILENVEKVVTQAKKLSKNISFSSILPRTDNDSSNIKIKDVNDSIRTWCNQNSVAFVDNDCTFLTADKSPNDALLLDGLHLNDKGTEKLIKNFNIAASPRRRRPRNLPNFTQNRTPLLPLPQRNNNNTGQTFASPRYNGISQRPTTTNFWTQPSSSINNQPQPTQWHTTPASGNMYSNWNQANYNPHNVTWNSSFQAYDANMARYCTVCHKHGHSAQHHNQYQPLI